MTLTAEDKALLLAVWREPGHFAIFYAMTIRCSGGGYAGTSWRLFALETAGLLIHYAGQGWHLTPAGRKLL